jgi:hypothetical protein
MRGIKQSKNKKEKDNNCLCDFIFLLVNDIKIMWTLTSDVVTLQKDKVQIYRNHLHVDKQL